MNPRLEHAIKIAKVLDAKSKKEKNADTAGVPFKGAVSNLRAGIANSRLKITTKKSDTEKSSDWHTAAQAGLEKSAADLKQLAVSGKDRLAEYWDSLSPSTKNMLINTMFGAAAGGTIGAGAGGMLAEKGQGLSQALGAGAAGALLGGATMGAGHAAYNALLGGRSLAGETKGKAVSDRMSQAVIGTAIKNPLLTAGTGVGGAITVKEILNQIIQKKDSKGKDIQSALDELLALRSTTSARKMLSALGSGGHSGLKLMGLPAGVAAGYLGDKYIRGDYD